MPSGRLNSKPRCLEILLQQLFPSLSTSESFRFANDNQFWLAHWYVWSIQDKAFTSSCLWALFYPNSSHHLVLAASSRHCDFFFLLISQILAKEKEREKNRSNPCLTTSFVASCNCCFTASIAKALLWVILALDFWLLGAVAVRMNENDPHCEKVMELSAAPGPATHLSSAIRCYFGAHGTVVHAAPSQAHYRRR